MGGSFGLAGEREHKRTPRPCRVQDMLGHRSPETTRIFAYVLDKISRSADRAAFGERMRKAACVP